MPTWNSAPADQSPSDFTPPSACPACGHDKVTTTAKMPTHESYWRCEACGEIWNVGRRTDGPLRKAGHANARHWA